MARYVTTIDSPRSPEDSFAELSDFSSAERWDPGVVRASRADDGPIAVGQRRTISYAWPHPHYSYDYPWDGYGGPYYGYPAPPGTWDYRGY